MPRPLTNLQQDFIKLVVITGESFTAWATNAKETDGSPFFGDKQFIESIRASTFLATQRLYKRYLNGTDTKWVPLEKKQINRLLEHLLPVDPIRPLTDEEFATQNTPLLQPRNMSRRNQSRSPMRNTKGNTAKDDQRSIGEVSEMFKCSDGCHTYFPGTLETVLGLEDDKFEEMLSVAKPLVLGRNWGYHNALLVFNDRMRVPGTAGNCSAYYLKLSAENTDKDKYKLASLREPHNDILLLQTPAQEGSESVDSLNQFLSELDLKTE